MAKKIWTMLIVAALSIVMLSMVACGGSEEEAGGITASDYVAAEFEKIKSSDADELLDTFLSDANIDKDNGSISTFIDKLRDFDYEIVSEESTSNGADVTVKITTYNFGQAFSSAYDVLLQKATDGELDLSDEKGIMMLLFEPLAEVSDKSYSQEVVIPCERTDDGWNGDFEGDDYMNALLGGFYSIMEK